MRIILLMLFFISATTLFSQSKDIIKDTIVDSRFSWTELQNKLRAHYFDLSENDFTKREKQSIGQLIDTRLTLITVAYVGFDKQIHKGQIICNQSVANDIKQIFSELLKIRFPIFQCKPISGFHFDDKESMQANNTTCFDFRFKTGSRQLSRHAYGLAIDINPVQNPYKKNNEILPANYDEKTSQGIIRISEETGKKVILILKKYGWVWGGNWRSLKDYMHFEKGR